MTSLADRIYRSIFANPKHFRAIYVLGTLLLQTNSAAEAEMTLRAAESLNPNSAEVQNNLGLALARQGKHAEALACYDRALAIRPGYTAALLNKANVLRSLGDTPGALDHYDQALAIEPSADIHYNRGAALEAEGRLDAAVGAYRAALALQPDFAPALNNLGNALAETGELAEALAVLDHAVSLAPQTAAPFVNRGAVLLALRRFDAAHADLNRALAMDPGLPEAFTNRGNVAREQGDMRGALEDYARALAIRPGDTQALWNRGLTRLLQGNWRDGWDDYERRRTRDSRLPAGLRDVPEWEGQNLAGKRILLHTEQGLGDVIQFCRFARQLDSVQTVLLVPPRLRALLSGLAQARPGLTIVSDAPAGPFDFRLPLLSLPRLLKLTPQTVPPSGGWLQPHPERLAQWRERLGGQGFKVGICWQGNPSGSIDSGRSMALRHIAPLADIAGVRLISLQTGFGSEQEMPGLEKYPGMDAGPDAFLDAAAIIAQCDLVITSDTAIAHLAGALGRPTWLALKLVPDWRWLQAGRDTPWYAQMRLYRQTRLDDWDTVFARIGADLSAAVRGEG